MFTQYFGSYLFESKVLTVQQYKDALGQIPGKRAKLGVLAIESGYMTPDQVEKTHAQQMQVDKRFGEIAIDYGYITDEQLGSLLKRQSSPFSVFSQIMVDNGWLSYAQLADVLEQYREQCGMSREAFQRFKEDDIQLLVAHMLRPYVRDEEELAIVLPYVEVFTKNIIRFIDENVTLGDPERLPQLEDTWHVCQQVNGTPTFTTAFTGRDDGLIYFSRKFSNMQIQAMDELGRDVLGEFLNCNNGVFLANMQDDHADFDLDPQYTTKEQPDVRKNTFRVPFTMHDSEYLLNLSF